MSALSSHSKLNLQRPLVFFDIESTGLNTTSDRIIEISLLKVFPDGSEESITRRINPEMPIPPTSTDVHGISNDDVKDAPTFKELAAHLMRFIEGCDLAGFNSNNFDLPMLGEEFARAGYAVDLMSRHRIDVQNIFHKMERRTLAAAYQFYCDKELTEAHSAEADTRATYEVLLAQIARYSNELKNDVAFLADFSSVKRNIDLKGCIVKNDQGIAVVNFGKHKGRPVEEVMLQEPGYYGWIMQSDFPEDTKNHFSRFYLKAHGKLKE